MSRADDGAYHAEPGYGSSKATAFDSNVYYGDVLAPDDPHSLTVDPKLDAPGTEGFGRAALAGYQLRPGSPAVGTGKFIQKNGGKDFWGKPVPSCGKTDRGASQANDCGGQNQ